MKKLFTLALLAVCHIGIWADVSQGNPTDCTSLIVNPSFEAGGEGWTVSGLLPQTNNDFARKHGTTYYEKWVSSNSAVGSGSAIQTINGLPAGIYRLTVGAQNLSQAQPQKENSGACIFADDAVTPVYGPADYSVEFTSVAGSAAIGFRAESASGNWIAVDNFRLYRIGDVSQDVVVAEISKYIARGRELLPRMMSAVAKSALQTAVDNAQAAIDAPEGGIDAAPLVSALREAIKVAEQSIAEYTALSSAVSDAEEAYDAGKAGAAEFRAAIDAAKALVANADATSEELAAGTEALAKALLAFRLANATAGTGTAPSVTSTNPYVCTGATEALVRAVFAGGNILERGVCWSTGHNPTVLDNRTVKSFSLNGLILHVKGLKPATVYYLRPYVMNNTYTVAYGDEIKIVTHTRGTCTASWDEGAPTSDANDRCRTAISSAIGYINEWAGVGGFNLSGHYGADTPTADCSYGGWMRIGPNAAYQAIGTVLHEAGHGVGVGTQARWWDTNLHNWKWLGREANNVYHFLENKYTDSEAVMVGDNMHGWGQNASYDWFINGADKDKHTELQYIGCCCLLYGMFVDGLCPTGQYPNGTAGYTYNFGEGKKYYLMNKSAERGLWSGLLCQCTSTNIGWRDMLQYEAVSDSAAWYMEYNAKNGCYSLRNAVSGKYLSRSSSSSVVSVKSVDKPAVNESFQFMPDRTDVTLGSGTDRFTAHGYWLTWNDGTDKAVSANEYRDIFGYGPILSSKFNFTNDAVDQQWIIISEDELPAVMNLVRTTGINNVPADKQAGIGADSVKDIYSLGGTVINGTAAGVNIVKHTDGSVKKIVR